MVEARPGENEKLVLEIPSHHLEIVAKRWARNGLLAMRVSDVLDNFIEGEVLIKRGSIEPEVTYFLAKQGATLPFAIVSRSDLADFLNVFQGFTNVIKAFEQLDKSKEGIVVLNSEKSSSQQ